VSFKAYAQTNKGTEFWTAYMLHNSDVPNPGGNGVIFSSSMVLYITSDISTTGSVEIGGSLLQNFNVTANAVTIIKIPNSAYLPGIGKFTTEGIHIISAKPIAVYAHIYASKVSGATLLLPVNAMGKEYMSLNYKQLSNASDENPAFSTFAIIATEDNTTVAITPSAILTDGSPAGTTFNVTLNKGEIYQGLASQDLTGTKIQSISTAIGSCKKIAVFSGSSRMGIGCVVNKTNDFSSDNLFQQVYPTSTWGKNYVTAPLANRPYDVFRIVLSDPNTAVTLNGTALSAASFVNGLYYEFKSLAPNSISADKPIQVVQYSPTQNQEPDCTIGKGDIGDPEMIYLSPIEQGLNHVTLYSTGYYAILQSYVNVVIPTSAASSVTIDGISYANKFIAVPNSNYSYAQIYVTSGPQAVNNTTSITAGTHTINASASFNAIAYGFGSNESYGYGAGANLQDLNEYVALQDPQNPTVNQIAGCSNIAYKLQVTIPYQTNNIVWKVDGVTEFTDTNPVVKATSVKNNIMLYTYEYNKLVNLTAGTHDVVATVFDPVADVCGSNQDIENDFSITDAPNVDFTVADTDCLGDSTQFTSPPTTGDAIKSWLWDFGDNTTSTLQNPKHKYAKAGPYVVHLTLVDYSGCTSTSNPKKVQIVALPVAGFLISSPDCSGRNVSFNGASSKTADGTIVSWNWDFGDGVKETHTDSKPVIHNYASVGPYNVKLTVTTDLGCTSDALTQLLTISPLPVADFTLPDVCLHDPYAQFTSISTIADHTESEFTYKWDFGDPASGNLNTSAEQAPRHVYHTQGNYTAKLTVTSKYGCDSTISKTFPVTASNPDAGFTVQKEANLCSSDSVAFKDDSKIKLNSIGNVIKLVWFFDYDNHPTDSVVFDKATMHSDKIYRHFYGINSTTVPQSYHVVLHAYSGQTCWTPYQNTITIQPNPVVTLMLNNTALATPLVLCQADAAVNITGNSNISGTETFTGTGITSAGVFDPKVAGVGTFTINYLFTANTGCMYATSFQVVVNATPDVSLPAQYTVLEGGQLTLRPVASIAGGDKLSYRWSPSTGLSQDTVANPIVSISDDITYTLTVTSDQGCPVSVQTFVKVLKVPVVPNTFTPNGDGINDTWEIKYLNEYPNVTVEIFNRYGTKVFFSNGYPKPWDGQTNGNGLPVGTYYYIISPNSGRKPIAGYVTIIR